MKRATFEEGIRTMLDWMTEQHRDHKTKKAYVRQIRRYASWLTRNRIRVAEMDSEQKIEAYLTFRAKEGCSASTQNGAFHALRCFYERGLKVELGDISALRATRPKRERRSPTIEEVRAILPMVPNLYGYPAQLICEWIYGSGLRVTEPLNARIKDIDFELSRFTVRDGKHGKDRVVPIPCAIIERLREQVEIAKFIWKQNVALGVPVPLPGRLAIKYPAAPFSWGWSWLFPAKTTCVFEGKEMRWRVHEAVIQRAFKKAVRASGVAEDLTPHHLRHAFVTHSSRMGNQVRDIQEVCGHKSLETTMGYLHPEVDRMRNPLDAMKAAALTPRRIYHLQAA